MVRLLFWSSLFWYSGASLHVVEKEDKHGGGQAWWAGAQVSSV